MQNRSPARLLRCTALAVAAAAATIAAGAPGAIPRNPDDRTVVHVLNRLGYGPRAGDVERVRRMGLGGYIDAQLHSDRIPDDGMRARLGRFETLGKSSRELAEQYFIPALLARRERQTAAAGPGTMAPPPEIRAARQVLEELAAQKILRSTYTERQLDDVMADFWFNHFNVFAGKGQVSVYLTEYERDTIRPRALGRFRDLLGATAHSPAMLIYLDNWRSAARGINENYARELMELHTLGVDGGYTQKDVQEVARAFTGWTITAPRQGGGFRFDARMHDDGEKTVLGHRLAAGGGERDGEEVLDLLASHPATARFIATKLARRLVADDPPRAIVDRAAATFRRTGGDIAEVVRTIVTSPEFFSKNAYGAKVKTPYEFVVSAARTSGAAFTNVRPLAQALRELGMPLYGCRPPTGYPDRADAWINPGALLTRMSVATMIARAAAAPQPLAVELGSPEFQRR